MNILLDRYRVLRVLGRGGFGKVYLAQDTELERQVAVKILDSSTGHRAARSRFQREAQLTSRFNHANVVKIFDFGKTEQDENYIVYEYVAGTDLRHYERPIEPALSCAWCRDVAAALSALHEMGVLHRDIKPANILIRDDDGRAVLCDFGLALEEEASTRYTRAGYIVGTPAYTAPEIWRGVKHDRSSDQFSLAATLFELVYEQKLIPAEDQDALLDWMHSDQVYQVPEEKKGLYPDLELVLERALAKLPDERYETMDEFAAELGRVIQNHVSSGEWDPPPEPRPEPPRKRKPRRAPGRSRLAVGLGIFLGICAAGGALFLAGGETRPPPPPPPTAPPGPDLPGLRERIRDLLERMVRDHEAVPGVFRNGSREEDAARTRILLDARFDLQWRRFHDALEDYLVAEGSSSDPEREPLLREVKDRLPELSSHLRYLRLASEDLDPDIALKIMPRELRPDEFLRGLRARLQPLQKRARQFFETLDRERVVRTTTLLHYEGMVVGDLLPERVRDTLDLVQEHFERAADPGERHLLLDMERSLLFRHAGDYSFPCEQRRRVAGKARDRLGLADVTADEELLVHSRGIALMHSMVARINCKSAGDVEKMAYHGLMGHVRRAVSTAPPQKLWRIRMVLGNLNTILSRGFYPRRFDFEAETGEIRMLLEKIITRQKSGAR